MEAGLRTGDKWQPFPEEINRRVAGVVADLHFAPTEHAASNLLREGVPDGAIVVTGNPVIDALQQIVRLACPPEARSAAGTAWACARAGGGWSWSPPTAARILAQPLEEICRALRALAETLPERLAAGLPGAPQPERAGAGPPPAGGRAQYHPAAAAGLPADGAPAEARHLVLTDSGGIQEEATGLGMPTLVLREVTERPEGVEAGVLKLVGTDPSAIVGEARRLLDDPAAYDAMAQAANPFGDGHAAERIVAALLARTRDGLSRCDRPVGLHPAAAGRGRAARPLSACAWRRGWQARGIRVHRTPTTPPAGRSWCIGGTRRLDGLWQARRRGVRIVQRLNGMNWIQRLRRTGAPPFPARRIEQPAAGGHPPLAGARDRLPIRLLPGLVGTGLRAGRGAGAGDLQRRRPAGVLAGMARNPRRKSACAVLVVEGHLDQARTKPSWKTSRGLALRLRDAVPRVRSRCGWRGMCHSATRRVTTHSIPG